jgi:molecular chaperone GrpE
MEDQKNNPTPENKPPSKHGRTGKTNIPPIPKDNGKPESESKSEPLKKEDQNQDSPQVPMVALTMEEFDALQNDLEKTRTKSNEYFDGWQHERADFLNYKKRIDRDAVFIQQNALISVVKKYLVILDDLDRALRARPTGCEGASWADGVELIYRKLTTLLEQDGVRRMEAEKETFNPTRHEAIIQEDSQDHESGQIIEVIQQGYLIGERVIRPALVRVAK